MDVDERIIRFGAPVTDQELRQTFYEEIIQHYPDRKNDQETMEIIHQAYDLYSKVMCSWEIPDSYK